MFLGLTETRLRRFMSKFVVAPSGCWEWTAAINSGGYGVFMGECAHRVAFAWFVAEFNEPQLDHLCRNRRCVNPRHLEPVTASENQRRAITIRDVCKRGHLMTPENTRVWSAGRGKTSRYCLACRRLRANKMTEARQRLDALAEEIA